MSNNELVPNSSTLPAELRELFDLNAHADDLSSGVSSGFPVVSIRGSKWRVKHSGEEHPILDKDGELKPSIEVVIVKAKPEVSKIFYKENYSEGDAEQPDCFSVNGSTPDANAHNKQSSSCTTCPHNQWGSRITPQGKKAKACSDNRRLAIVPADDIRNEVMGGAMLLRVPAASLSDLSTYGKKMVAKGYPYNSVVTRLGFDHDAAYPKLTFKAVRPLEDDELRVIAEHMQSASVATMMNELTEISRPSSPEVGDSTDESQKQLTVDDEFEQPPVEETPTPTKTAKKKTKKKSSKKAQPEPEADSSEADSSTVDTQMDEKLDSILSQLDDMG